MMGKQLYIITNPKFRRGQIAAEYYYPEFEDELYLLAEGKGRKKANIEYIPVTREMLVKAIREIDVYQAAGSLQGEE